MVKYIDELLAELDKDISNGVDLVKYKGNAALREILKHACLPQFKFILPEEAPPYKKDAAPQGMSMSNIYQEVRRFYVFLRADLKPVKREGLFISLLEGLHPNEAEVMILVKDQTLHYKYPNIRLETIQSLL